MTDEQLLEAAHLAREQAYAPYSGFLVGAAILADDGQVYSGCNVENAAYPEGVCAEAGALSAMILGGARRALTVAIVAGPPGDLRTCLPCGGCRQKIAEFSRPDTTILTAGSSGRSHRHAISDLLPLAFTPTDIAAG
jgi:cytidine deaminase